jgi:calcineurin-like phosphoesterase family protein
VIYFTADTHFGHEAILRHCPERMCAFGDIETMDTTLIDNINNVVGRNDTLYHLGDFCWKNAGHYRQRIRCRKIHVVRGNHDSSSLKKCVSTMNHMLFLKKLKLHACHYPLESWLWSPYNGIHFHGHSHGRLRQINNRLDVGIDSIFKLTGEWRPVSIDEALERT